MLENHARPQHAACPLSKSSSHPPYVSYMHAAVFMYMLYSGMPCPYMNGLCSTACMCRLFMLPTAPIAYRSVFISMEWHEWSPRYLQAHAVRGLILVQHPSLLAPRSYRLFRVHSRNVISQPLQTRTRDTSSKSLDIVALEGRGLGDTCSYLLATCTIGLQTQMGHHPV